MSNPMKKSDREFKITAEDMQRYADLIRKQAVAHKTVILTVLSVGLIADNLLIRYLRSRERKLCQERALKQQSILRKQEAQIRALQEESERAQEAVRKVELLEQIVKNMTEGSDSQ